MKKEFKKRILSSLIIIPAAFFFIIKGSIFFNFFILAILTITLYEWHFLSLKKIYYLPGFIFIIFFLYTCYFFRIEGDYKIFLLLSFCKLRCTFSFTVYRSGKRQTDAFLRFQTYFRPLRLNVNLSL